MDLIDVNKLKSDIEKESDPYGYPTITYTDGKRVIELIDKLPIIHIDDTTLNIQCELAKLKPINDFEITFVRHGEWVMNNPYAIKICSLCGYGQSYGAENYCPNCGAIMDGGKER